MARAKQVKAGKDYPNFGIKKGDLHWVWSMKTQRGGIVKRQIAKPRDSQLTMSEYKSQAHALNERLADQLKPDLDLAGLESLRDDVKSDAESLRDEQQEKLDNMPEGLQQGSTGELIQERIDALEAFIDELENLDFDNDYDPNDDDAFEVDADASKQEGRVLNEDGETMEEWRERMNEEHSELIQEKFEELGNISLDVG